VIQPMYGMPQPNSYGQYGFGGYAGFQGAGGAGTTGTNPGMPQANNVAGSLGNGTQPGTTDPSAGGQPTQGQWPADPNSYYSSYWGGEQGSLSLFTFLNQSLIGFYQPGQQGAGDVQMNQN
jgi:nucleolysin TIA-1/TIAR